MRMNTVEPIATNPITAAAIAKAVSMGLRLWPTTIGTGAAGRDGAAAAGREGATGAAAPTRGALGACDGAALARLGAGAEGAAVGPPGGSVGNLIVGAAEGLGGKLIRTVSFFG